MYTAAIAYQVNNPLPDTSGKKLYFFFENVSKLKKKINEADPYQCS